MATEEELIAGSRSIEEVGHDRGDLARVPHSTGCRRRRADRRRRSAAPASHAATRPASPRTSRSPNTASSGLASGDADRLAACRRPGEGSRASPPAGGDRDADRRPREPALLPGRRPREASERNTRRPLFGVRAETDADGRRLTLTFSGGRVIDEEIDELGDPVVTAFWDRPVRGRCGPGPVERRALRPPGEARPAHASRGTRRRVRRLAGLPALGRLARELARFGPERSASTAGASACSSTSPERVHTRRTSGSGGECESARPWSR